MLLREPGVAEHDVATGAAEHMELRVASQGLAQRIGRDRREQLSRRSVVGAEVQMLSHLASSRSQGVGAGLIPRQ